MPLTQRKGQKKAQHQHKRSSALRYSAFKTPRLNNNINVTDGGIEIPLINSRLSNEQSLFESDAQQKSSKRSSKMSPIKVNIKDNMTHHQNDVTKSMEINKDEMDKLINQEEVEVKTIANDRKENDHFSQSFAVQENTNE